MKRNYIHPARECYSSFYGLEKFKGVPQFAFQTVQGTCTVLGQWTCSQAVRQPDKWAARSKADRFLQVGRRLDRQKIRNVDSSAANMYPQRQLETWHQGAKQICIKEQGSQELRSQAARNLGHQMIKPLGLQTVKKLGSWAAKPLSSWITRQPDGPAARVRQLGNLEVKHLDSWAVRRLIS